MIPTVAILAFLVFGFGTLVVLVVVRRDLRRLQDEGRP